MNRLRFSFPKYDVPPGKLTFTHRDGHITEAPDRETWFRLIKKHYADNAYPLPDDWKELAEDQLCRILPPGWCKYYDGTDPSIWINTRMELGDYFRGMEVLMAVATNEDALVSQEVANERARICAACPANQQVQGCAPCIGVSNMILKVKGAKATPADGLLKACAVCKCSNAAQVWVKGSLLAKGVSQAQLDQFATLPHCWKTAALQESESLAPS